MAKEVVERYGAIPYAFLFEKVVEADPVEVDGQLLKVEPKTIETSGFYFINGTLETLDDLVKKNDPKENILRSNMKYNDFPIICNTCNGFKHTAPFREQDVVVDNDGNITERGDDPKYIEYRNYVIAETKMSEI